MGVANLTVMAIVAAGSNTPPTPKPEIVPRAVASFGFSGVTHARAPLNAAKLWLVKLRKSMKETLTHDNTADNQDLPIMTLPQRQSSIAKSSTQSNTESITQPLQANLNWIWAVFRGKGQREEIQQRIEVHSGDKGSEKRHAHDLLPPKNPTWHHRKLCELPLPYDP